MSGTELTGVDTIAKSIVEYGVLVIIAAIFLYTAIRVINMYLGHWGEKLSHSQHDKLIDTRVRLGEQIQNLIESYLANSNASRVSVIEFSNTLMSVAYLPFRYMTCTYEVHDLGKVAMGHKIDRISTSLFTPFFVKLQENPCCLFDINDKSTLVGGAMCDLMKEQGEHLALCISLTTAKGKAIGYIQATSDTEFTDYDIALIKTLGNQVSLLLSIGDK